VFGGEVGGAKGIDVARVLNAVRLEDRDLRCRGVVAQAFDGERETVAHRGSILGGFESEVDVIM
jgi:hypothetical protein